MNFKSFFLTDYTYKKPKVVPGKANCELQMSFMILLHHLKSSLGKNDKIYFADANHPHHNSMPSYGWIKKGEKKELQTNSGRQRLNLHGAIGPVSLHFIVREDSRINSDSTLRLIKEIERKNPFAKKVYMIVDNASYYHSEIVKEYLSTSKVKFVYLPPYSPNLNLIERLWKFFHKEVLCNSYYEQFTEFKDATFTFFKNLRIYKKELKSLLSKKVEFVPVG